MNLISSLVFPTLLLLQTILSYLHDNHVIVIYHCYMRLSFQWYQTVVLL